MSVPKERGIMAIHGYLICFHISLLLLQCYNIFYLKTWTWKNYHYMLISGYLCVDSLFTFLQKTVYKRLMNFKTTLNFTYKNYQNFSCNLEIKCVKLANFGDTFLIPFHWLCDYIFLCCAFWDNTQWYNSLLTIRCCCRVPQTHYIVNNFNMWIIMINLN